ncbi:hypothetical protein MBLNU459_g0735t1 [Dothideomycetes sp. NU459]
MAHPNGVDGLQPPTNEWSNASPALLVDNTGAPIIPSVVPPKTTTPAYSEQNLALGEQASSAGPTHRSEDYFVQDGQLGNSNTGEDVEAKDYTAPATKPQRADSVPHANRPRYGRTWQTERPRVAPRGSALRAGFNRRASSGARPSDNSRTPYSYKFDDPSDDSQTSSSSSSEDEAAPHGKKRHVKKAKAHIPGRKHHKKAQGPQYSKFNVGNDSYQSKGRVSKRDGRLNISINETNNNGYIAKALGQRFKNHLNLPAHHGHHLRDYEYAAADSSDQELQRPESGDAASIASSVHRTVKRPRLNIVIMVIGSRGDIQPFLQIGRELKKYGHRVRIATHPAFKSFVENDVGLEFFSVGGDPSELMAFMVKNPGLIPSMETVRQGEIARRRKGMAEMFEGFWRACVNATDDEQDRANIRMMGDRSPFIADAIIANPPSFAHVHIAERLGIPLHIMFTFPYTPTQAFPHPLANIKPQKSNVDTNYVNFMSYPLVEMMTWQGLGDLVNNFRKKTLGLEPVSSLWAPGALFRMKVPYTYMWSPGLAPKPKDWGPEIDIGGYVFLDLASNFNPPKELTDFLDAGDKPVYIGFGSIVVDDPDKFTKLIFDAVKKAGVRALVSKGWGGLGDEDNTPDNIFMLENTPHDWLFPKVSAVIHHGGAGTTAIGLKCGKPTMIVPFFGDQPFWGSMVAEKKAGAHQSIPYKKLTVDKLAEGIKQCLTKEAQENVQKIADSIATEGDGAANAVKSFHRSLPFAGKHSMRCSILEDRVAVWHLKHSNLRLSALAAELLIEEKKINWHNLRLIRHYEWNDFDGPGEPISGIGGALMDTGAGMAKGVGMVPIRMARHIKKREEHEKKKKAHEQRKADKLATKQEKRQNKSSAKAQNTDTGGQQDEERADRPQAPRHTDTTATNMSVMSADAEHPLAQELAVDAGRGFLTTGEALLSAPLDLSLALAQGFHNAPRLYGDGTVRKPIRITGMHSGARAARHELVYGVYDGFSGLVMQPVHGWQEGRSVPGRVAGLGKGFAKGIGGFVLKDISAIITPPTFLAQGARKEISKRIGGPGTTGFIRKARIMQGAKDLQALKAYDQEHGEKNFEKTQNMVEEGWHVMREVWFAKEHHATRHGGAVRGRLSVHREQKRWLKNGALENVDATSRALEAKKQGKDLDKMFAQRRKEIEIAEQPRASAMDQPVAYEDGAGVGPNGHYKHHPRKSMGADDRQTEAVDADPKATGAIDASGVQRSSGDAAGQPGASDGETSDTAVESPGEDSNQVRSGTTDTPSKTVGSEGVDRMTNATNKLDQGKMPQNADEQSGRQAVAV